MPGVTPDGDYIVQEAIGREAVIRASQDGIDMSPITTNRNMIPH
jgi:hypothetical protein